MECNVGSPSIDLCLLSIGTERDVVPEISSNVTVSTASRLHDASDKLS